MEMRIKGNKRKKKKAKGTNMKEEKVSDEQTV
jgi:hypothetical protein